MRIARSAPLLLITLWSALVLTACGERAEPAATAAPTEAEAAALDRAAHRLDQRTAPPAAQDSQQLEREIRSEIDGRDAHK